MVQNSEHFSPLRNTSERNSENFLFRRTAGIPPEQTNCSVYSVFRGIIFWSDIANPTLWPVPAHPPVRYGKADHFSRVLREKCTPPPPQAHLLLPSGPGEPIPSDSANSFFPVGPPPHPPKLTLSDLLGQKSSPLPLTAHPLLPAGPDEPLPSGLANSFFRVSASPPPPLQLRSGEVTSPPHLQVTLLYLPGYAMCQLPAVDALLSSLVPTL